MKLIKTVSEMQAWSRELHAKGKKLSFVPTMGALHEGHISLINYAHEHAEQVVVSIFVNPLQFDNKEDLEKYPRGDQDDLLICEAERVDVIFMPSDGEMYPAGFQTNVQVKEITQSLCGAAREGHFDGVATVVLKLFNMVLPDSAVFGEKDFQQLAMIRRMVTDLNLPLEIISHPIVREQDGLALSSRNRRLSKEEREQGLVLYHSIQAVQEEFAKGERNVDRLLGAANHILNVAKGIKIDYAEIRDAGSLEEIKHVDQSTLYAVAAFVGPVRLIDNCILEPSDHTPTS